MPKIISSTLFATFLLGSICSGSAQKDPAAVKDTLSRLEKVLSRYATRSVGGYLRRFDAREFKGCEITYEITPEVPPDHKGFVPFSQRTKIYLSALDPLATKLIDGENGNSSLIIFSKSGEREIETSIAAAPHEFGKVSRSRAHNLTLTNKAAAQEALALMQQAIEQCK